MQFRLIFHCGFIFNLVLAARAFYITWMLQLFASQLIQIKSKNGYASSTIDVNCLIDFYKWSTLLLHYEIHAKLIYHFFKCKMIFLSRERTPDDVILIVSLVFLIKNVRFEQ